MSAFSASKTSSAERGASGAVAGAFQELHREPDADVRLDQQLLGLVPDVLTGAAADH